VGKHEVAECCSESACPESAIVSIGERRLCSKHFLQHSYQALEAISAGMRELSFDDQQAETTSRQLEECMRGAADIACSPAPPPNIERARVVDVLLWASELHEQVRRSPRVSARIPVLLCSEVPDKPWEEKTATSLLSHHGMQVFCQAQLRPGDSLICVRLDNGRRVKARVAWTRPASGDGIEAGLEFSSAENFWGIDWGGGREMPKA
jgi:hypothetical protein